MRFPPCIWFNLFGIHILQIYGTVQCNALWKKGEMYLELLPTF